MPVFEYKALNAKGRAANGVIDADTARDAREKLRQQKIYVTGINEVRGTQTKREVVKNEKGEKQVVVSAELPTVAQATGTLAIISAGVLLLQLVLAWRGQSSSSLDGQAAADAITPVRIAVTIISAGATAMFGYVILKRKTWALTVTALFAVIEAIGPFSKLVTIGAPPWRR